MDGKDDRRTSGSNQRNHLANTDGRGDSGASKVKHKVFIEHGPDAFESASSRIRDGITSYERTNLRLADDLTELVAETDDFQQVSVEQAAQIAEKVLTLANRRAWKQILAQQQQRGQSSHEE